MLDVATAAKSGGGITSYTSQHRLGVFSVIFDTFDPQICTFSGCGLLWVFAIGLNSFTNKKYYISLAFNRHKGWFRVFILMINTTSLF